MPILKTPALRVSLTSDEWEDAADLFEQGASLAEMSSNKTHSSAARKYATKRMNSLAMFATGKAMMERKKREQNERDQLKKVSREWDKATEFLKKIP